VTFKELAWFIDRELIVYYYKTTKINQYATVVALAVIDIEQIKATLTQLNIFLVRGGNR